MSQYTVLICDDNEVVHQSLSLYLKSEGIQTVSVYDGETALEKVRSQNFDLVILDIMLPKMFGTELCRQIRKFSDVPIIFLSAKSEEMDKIIGLELGADDYVTKPFSPRELAVRIRTVLRRSGSRKANQAVQLGNLIVNAKAYEVSIKGEPVKLTPREVELLAFLVEHQGEVVSRDDIINAVWGENYYGDYRAVDTLIARIRSKIPEYKAGVEFKSVYGVGYMINERSKKE
jgi:DNA-binding response OmpR family regulator